MREPPAIEAFGGGGFRVAGVRRQGSILILDDVVAPWGVSAVTDLSVDDLQPVLDLGAGAIEFILLGVGSAMVPPPRAVREAMQAARIGLEVMVTAEACRLYNVLASEGRRVGLAAIAV